MVKSGWRRRSWAAAGTTIEGLWAGYALAIPVGALAVLLVTVTAQTSLRVGAAGALGTATADGLYAVAAVAGGAALTQAIAPVTDPLRLIAAVVLAGMAVRIAVTALRNRGGPDPADARKCALSRPKGAYLGFLGLTMLNPWTIIYFGALVLSGQVVGGLTEQSAYIAAVILASASWQLLLATGGAVVGRVLTGPRGRLATALVSSLVIVSLAICVAGSA